MAEKNDIGTVTSTFEGPSPSNLDFVVNLPEGIVHRGQYVEMDYSEGTLVALVTDVIKTNRYFERAESVKEFESNGKSLFEQFPTAEWEYLIAKTKPLGVYTKKGVKRATYPPSPGTRVRSATPEILKKFLGLDEEKGLHLGEVEYHSLPINLNLSRLFQKHVAVLAMSGAGKSYMISVIIEELLNRKKEDGRLAIIIMDAHGEYNSFAEPVTDKTHKDFSSKAKVIKAKDIRIGVPKLSGGILGSVIPGLTSAQRRDIERILNSLRNGMKNSGPFDLRDVKNAITQDDEMKEQTKAVLNSWLTNLEELRLFARTDNPSINDLVVPGMLTIVDLSDIVNLRKKQIIVSYFAQKLFNERRQKRLPPYLMVVEEAHQFAPERTKEEAALSKRIIETIAREGRKFGASLCLISQRPIHLSTTALAQCNTHIILRVTNPYDLKHIGESSEGLDSRSLEMITSLRVGEALMVGEAVNYPVFFKVRERTSLPSKHEISLEEAALRFEAGREKEDKEAEEFL